MLVSITVPQTRFYGLVTPWPTVVAVYLYLAVYWAMHFWMRNRAPFSSEALRVPRLVLNSIALCTYSFATYTVLTIGFRNAYNICVLAVKKTALYCMSCGC